MATELRMFPLLGLVAIWRLTLAWWVGDPLFFSAPLLTRGCWVCCYLIGDKGCVAGGHRAGTKAQSLGCWSPPTCRDPTRVGTLERGGGSREEHQALAASRPVPGSAPSERPPASAGSSRWPQMASSGCPCHSMPSGWCWGPGACRESQPRKQDPGEHINKQTNKQTESL